MKLVGDSHAAQWFPALARASAPDGWGLTSLTKSACPFVDVPVVTGAYRRPFVECDVWRTRILARIRAEQPDLVVVSASTPAYRSLLVAGAVDFDRVWAGGLTRMIEQLPAGSRVVVLGDSPQWPRPSVFCLSGALSDAGGCARSASALTDGALSGVEATAARAAGAQYVPTVPWLCAATCPAIVGNVVVYRDEHHVTATFSGLLAPVVGRDVLGGAGAG